MNFLSEKRVRALKLAQKADDYALLDKLLMEGARSQWKQWLGYKNAVRKRHEAYERRKKKRAALDAANNVMREKLKRAADRLAKKAEARRLEVQLIKMILPLIQNKKLNPTGNFMKSIKDPELKRKVIEATCLSKV